MVGHRTLSKVPKFDRWFVGIGLHSIIGPFFERTGVLYHYCLCSYRAKLALLSSSTTRSTSQILVADFWVQRPMSYV